MQTQAEIVEAMCHVFAITEPSPDDAVRLEESLEGWDCIPKTLHLVVAESAALVEVAFLRLSTEKARSLMEVYTKLVFALGRTEGAPSGDKDGTR